VYGLLVPRRGVKFFEKSPKFLPFRSIPYKNAHQNAGIDFGSKSTFMASCRHCLFLYIGSRKIVHLLGDFGRGYRITAV